MISDHWEPSREPGWFVIRLVISVYNHLPLHIKYSMTMDVTDSLYFSSVIHYNVMCIYMTALSTFPQLNI